VVDGVLLYGIQWTLGGLHQILHILNIKTWTLSGLKSSLQSPMYSCQNLVDSRNSGGFREFWGNGILAVVPAKL
jgi:hypothetical protein